MKKIYVASPLGFAESTRVFYNQVFLPMIKAAGYEIFDPWVLTDAALFDNPAKMPLGEERCKAYAFADLTSGKNNQMAIESCDMIVAILDGVDVDSGTASEIGYGCAKGKKVIGYRGDFRKTGENDGCLINLQVEYFIKHSGGEIYTNLEDLKKALTDHEIAG